MDDILALAVLSVASSIVVSDGGVNSVDIMSVAITLLEVLGFFAIIGAQVDFRTVHLEILLISVVVILVAVVTKLAG